MLNLLTTWSLRTITVASCFLLAAANAQDAYDVMSGRSQTLSPPSTMMALVITLSISRRKHA
jgi:hypothetical protein